MANIGKISAFILCVIVAIYGAAIRNLWGTAVSKRASDANVGMGALARSHTHTLCPRLGRPLGLARGVQLWRALYPIPLTYSELECRASQLAHRLKGLGVGPDVLVGLFVERAAEMIVDLLGTLEAGGADVTMDTGFP